MRAAPRQDGIIAAVVCLALCCLAMGMGGCDDTTPEPLAEVLPEPGMAMPLAPSDSDACTYGPQVDEQRPLNRADDVGEGFFATKHEPLAPRSGDTGDLELTLTGSSEIAVGDGPQLRLSFRNQSDAPITLMRSLDGSAEHWRFPTYDVYARDEAGQAYRWAHFQGRCGNVNPLAEDDFVTVAPGAASDRIAGSWADLWSITFPKPGQYDVWVVYTMCDSEDVHGVGIDPDQSAQLARHGVRFGSWSSNALVVTVR